MSACKLFPLCRGVNDGEKLILVWPWRAAGGALFTVWHGTEPVNDSDTAGIRVQGRSLRSLAGKSRWRWTRCSPGMRLMPCTTAGRGQ